MCGLVAYVGRDAPEHASVIDGLNERLRHRGPDDSGHHRLRNAALAHRRLSIIDVNGGKQPLLDVDGAAALVCNGEIYNHRAIRAELEPQHRFRTGSDSEAILHLYKARGSASVEELDGMFAFVVADGDGFLAARDPFGIKPLYAGRDAEGSWFASELKALPAACRDVKEIPPGSLLTESGEVRRWFNPPWRDPASEPVAAEPSVLTAKLETAVVKRLMSDVPLGVFLSGGLDSSIISGLVRRHRSDLHSFAVGMDGAPDLPAARCVADHLGTRHHEYRYTPTEATRALEHVIYHLESYDAALIRSAVPCYFVSKLASEHVKVVLSGEGADEAFAGYRYMSEIHDPAALHRECVRLLLNLHNMNLQRVDRMTMAHALEGRVPFLDVDFVAWAMALDPAEKLQRPDRPEKWLLRNAFESLLPSEIVWRKKEEFAAGCGSEDVFRDHGERSVTDADFGKAAERFPIDTPTTKEAFLYRRVFEERFPGESARGTVGRWLGTATSANTGGEVRTQ